MTLLRNAQVLKLRDRRSGRTVTESWSTSWTAATSGSRGDIVVVVRRRGELGEAAAESRQRQAPRTAWPTAPTRSAATTCSTTAWRSWRSRMEPNPTDVPEDAGAQRLLLRRRRLPVPDGQRPDGRQDLGADVPGREAVGDRCSLPTFALLDDVAMHAVDFWLSTEDLPEPGQPGHGRCRRTHRAELHRRTTRGLDEAVRPAEVDAEPSRHAPAPPDPARLPT